MRFEMFVILLNFVIYFGPGILVIIAAAKIFMLPVDSVFLALLMASLSISLFIVGGFWILLLANSAYESRNADDVQKSIGGT